jgi:hypothetical protein
MTGLSYKSALFLMHRIRWAMADENPRPLSGDVEVDETYVGGKPRYPRMGKRGHGTKKARVMAMVERGGEIRPIHLRRIGAGELKRAVLEHMDSSARILSDEERSYTKLGQHFSGGHEAVKHSAGEYARGDVHVNTAEGFFALLKRGIHGTFHSVSKKHLHRYLSEFQFRWNTRGLDDGARTAQAIRKADGKRLVYRESKAKTEQE